MKSLIVWVRRHNSTEQRGCRQLNNIKLRYNWTKKLPQMKIVFLLQSYCKHHWTFYRSFTAIVVWPQFYIPTIKKGGKHIQRNCMLGRVYFACFSLFVRKMEKCNMHKSKKLQWNEKSNYESKTKLNSNLI